MGQKIAFTSSEEKIATEAMDKLIKLYDNCALDEADIIVALGGDGFMLQTLKRIKIVNKKIKKVKILGSGEIRDKIDIIANFFSKSAIDKISKAGGSYQINKK